MRRLHGICAMLLLGVGGLLAQTQLPTRDVLGVHDMSAGTSPVHGQNANACLYCHAPHSGIKEGPLWSQSLSVKTYGNLYTSNTAQNTARQPALGSDSNLCLSCHDGTVALGQTVPYGKLSMSAALSNPLDKLEASHPFSLTASPPDDAASLVPSLHLTGQTADQAKAVQLVKGNVECTSCHEPHRQAIDQYSLNFLVKDNRKSGICLSCHTVTQRKVKGIDNPLQSWDTSAHAVTDSAYKPQVGLGGYLTVADSGCDSCHMPHNAGGAKGLLRHSTSPAPNADDASQSCINCHNGGSDKLTAPLMDVYSEFGKKSHPFPITDNLHTSNEAVVLDQNRHASCVDCHNAHSSKLMPTGSFNAAPAVRPSQFGAAGVAADGSSLTGTVVNQYENCLRCHGNSAGKRKLETTFGYTPTRAAWGGDELNLILQFGVTANSSHPVMRDASPSADTQPSLLPAMMDRTGTNPVRPLQPGPIRIFCTDCHNNDQSREFGGSGPNGPHGSIYDHILEREYVASKVNEGSPWPTGGPGTSIINPNMISTPYPHGGGPYALCAKCHDLDNIMLNRSFLQHNAHISKGLSCSACHSAHGVPAGSTNGSVGRRLINFDVRVVAPNGTTTSYNADGTCTLTCHMVKHSSNGGLQQVETLTEASPRPF